MQINEDKVILSKEEFEKYVLREKMQTIGCKSIYNIRKQAKEDLKAFAEEIKMYCACEFGGVISYEVSKKINEIAERYGVNIKNETFE